MGLSFCPDGEADKFELVKDLHLFARRLMYKVLYDNQQNATALPENDNSILDNVALQEMQALQDLMSLWDESNPEEEGWTYQIPGVVPGMSIQSRSNKPVYVVPKTYKPKS